MRHLIILLVGMLMCSCMTKPNVKITHPDGTVTEYNMGTNFMGEEKETVASIDIPGGPKIKFMQGASDGTRVPSNLITAAGAAYGANILGKVEMNASNNATKETLGAQGVQKNKDLLNAQGAAFGTAAQAGTPVGQAVPPGGIPIQ